MHAILGAAVGTFYEHGYDHRVDHSPADAGAPAAGVLEVTLYDEDGALATPAVDPGLEVSTGRLVGKATSTQERVMVASTRGTTTPSPVPPHHYAYFHRRGSTAAPLYYAVNAALGGVPDRIGATNINIFETYVFRQQPFAETYSLLLGCLARFVPVQAQVFAYYGSRRIARDVTLAPKCHTEVQLPAEDDGERLARVEVKALFRLLSYVVGRRAGTGDLVLFDHLFTYAK
jgi:hypothetical protein